MSFMERRLEGLYRYLGVAYLTSMVVMKELGVMDIITGDEHFAHVGMGFRKYP